MKQVFLLGILGGIALSLVGYGVFLVLRSIYEMFRDWREGKQIDELSRLALTKQRQQAADNESRLNNGCRHEFEWTTGAFARQICRRCGMEAKRPTEACDHQWRRGEDPVPTSYCHKCGKELVGTRVGTSR